MLHLLVMVVGGCSAAPKNFLLIAVDDLRPMFGKSFGVEEVLTPKMDAFFTEGNGWSQIHPPNGL